MGEEQAWTTAVAALRRVAFLLERDRAARYKAKAFRTAAGAVERAGARRVADLAARGTLQDLPGLGPATAGVAAAAIRGEPPAYLVELERAGRAVPPEAARLRGALRGDLHSHTEASDGAAPLAEMVLAAVELGHEYLAVTDHSPRLKVARGLSAERLRAQLAQVEALNRAVAPFRVLTGIEVDILEDGGLDQEPELLRRLDVVVASVHSALQMEPRAMTRRLLAAVADPSVTVLGHCTGRKVEGRTRPQSRFDAAAVFGACADLGVAVEINSQPERQDPPGELIELALAAGCDFSIDSDAHAPGELDWQVLGCARAAAHGVPPERVINTGSVADLAARRRRRALG